MPKLITHVSP